MIQIFSEHFNYQYNLKARSVLKNLIGMPTGVVSAVTKMFIGQECFEFIKKSPENNFQGIFKLIIYRN